MKIVLSLLVGAFAALAHADGPCAFLQDASPIEMQLPSSALSHPLVDLPLKFEGVTPVVRRRIRAVGSVPKVIVERYSSAPTIEYDDVSGSVLIKAEGCGGSDVGGNDPASSAWKRNSGLAVFAGALLANMNGDNMGKSLASVLLALPMAQGRRLDACTPQVEVVVEAPDAYMGAVEVCKAEVPNVGHCPKDFPTFATCSEQTPTCSVAVVGAGTGGLYTAMRMVDTGKIEASDVCVFEMTERVGGRLYSLRGLGPDGDLSVDAGGYRTWPQFTPTLHALITEYLQIPMDCYDESEEPCQKFNIVDENGQKAGFATFVEEMMSRLVDGGACYFPYHELESISRVAMDSSVAQSRLIESSGEVTELMFTNGVKATATFTTILNVPQRPLLNILRNSDLPSSVLDARKLDAVHSVQTLIVSKLYLYYPKGHVFWYKLGLRTGDFEFEGDARNMLLAGRYHDGHVECDDDNDPETCHGFLLAVYANDLSGNKAQFFRRYQRERPEPITIISNSDLEGSEFLKHAHARLEEFHLYGNENAPYTGFEASNVFQDSAPPEFAVLSTWNTAIPWAGGGWHSWTDLSDVDLSMNPLGEDNIFVINEAYSLLQGWAEGTLKAADTILETYFDCPRPWSFPAFDFNQVVAQTQSTECQVVEEDTTSGGAGGGVVDNDGGANPALCFTGDAKVHMADGSFKALKDVEKGDLVLTGTGSGTGLVTKKLSHEVGKTVPVAYVNTPGGILVGEPSHPVLMTGEWRELRSAEHSDMVKLSTNFVDVFYNLEIDGDDIEGSSHSYVVNGIIASGLGDDDVLNERFPRQEVWKSAVVAAAAAA